MWRISYALSRYFWFTSHSRLVSSAEEATHRSSQQFSKGNDPVAAISEVCVHVGVKFGKTSLIYGWNKCQVNRILLLDCRDLLSLCRNLLGYFRLTDGDFVLVVTRRSWCKGQCTRSLSWICYRKLYYFLLRVWVSTWCFSAFIPTEHTFCCSLLPPWYILLFVSKLIRVFSWYWGVAPLLL